MPPKAASRRPRAYLLWGQEELRKKEFLQQLIEELVPAEDRELDVQYVDATNAGVTGDSLLHAVRDRAMFSEQRVLVVLNAGRLRGPRHQRTQELLAEGIPRLPDHSTLILFAYAEEADERRGRSPFSEKLMSAIIAAGVVNQFAPLKPEELAQLAAQEAAQAGKKLAPPAALQLAQRLGADSQRALQEVRKLVDYVGDRPNITIQDVEAMAPPPPDDNIFHLLDAAMKGDRRQALGVLRQLRESGMAVPQILPMLGRTLRQAAQAKLLQERRVPANAEADAVPADVLALLPEDGGLYRTTKDWQRRRLWEQSRHFAWGSLHRALDRLAVLDAGTKGWEYGVEDPDMALELFVSSLCDSVR